VLATDAEGAEVGAASAKRARHGSETEVRLPPAYAHPVAHPAPAPSRTNMCCRAYHYAFAFAAVAAVAALAAVALAATAIPLAAAALACRRHRRHRCRRAKRERA
jgi:hypothetical protein